MGNQTGRPFGNPLSSVISSTPLTQDRFHQVWSWYDADKDGKLNEKESRAFLVDMCSVLTAPSAVRRGDTLLSLMRGLDFGALTSTVSVNFPPQQPPPNSRYIFPLSVPSSAEIHTEELEIERLVEGDGSSKIKKTSKKSKAKVLDGEKAFSDEKQTLSLDAKSSKECDYEDSREENLAFLCEDNCNTTNNNFLLHNSEISSTTFSSASSSLFPSVKPVHSSALPSHSIDTLSPPELERERERSAAPSISENFNSSKSLHDSDDFHITSCTATSSPSCTETTTTITPLSPVSWQAEDLLKLVLQGESLTLSYYHFQMIFQNLSTRGELQMTQTLHTELQTSYFLNQWISDLLPRVASFLPQKDVLTCCLVNKSWRNQLYSRLLWCLNLSLKRVKTLKREEYAKVLTCGRRFAIVSFWAQPISAQDIVLLTCSCPDLVFVNLQDCASLDDVAISLMKGYRSLGVLLKGSPGLTSVGVRALFAENGINYFSACHLPNLDDEAFRFGRQYENLKRMMLIKLPKVTDNCLKWIGECCPNLESLNLCHLRITNTGLTYLAAGLHKLTRVRLISLDRITTTGLEDLIQANPDLKDLRLMYCSQLDDDTVKMISHRSPGLTELLLGIQVTCNCVPSLSSMKSLRVLRLYNTSLSVASVLDLAQSSTSLLSLQVPKEYVGAIKSSCQNLDVSPLLHII